MKVLIVSHAYVERDNHQKLEILAGYKDLSLAVIYPKTWRTWHGEEKKSQVSSSKSQDLYQEFTLDTAFSGDGGKYFYNPIQLIISIISFRPDLIYFEEEPFSFAGFQLSVISWLLRIKFIFFTWENIALSLGLIRNLTEKFVFWSAAAGLAGNQAALQRIKSRGFNKQSSIIPQFGVDTAMFRRNLFVKRTPSADFIVGFVGRPTWEKGLDILLEALSQLPEKFRLLVVTSSLEIPTQFLELTGKLNLEQRVIFKTQIAHDRLPEYFNQMNVFVLPSRTTENWKEQFGRTLIEAMACGVPVIGSSSGAIPEVINDAGLIFNEGKSDDLAKKIIEMADPALGQRLVELASKRMMENYSYPKICQDFYELVNR